jgi:hypothetical protein
VTVRTAMTIDDVRAKVNDQIMFACPREWEGLVVELDRQLTAIDPDYTIVQVKPKFDGLRYYFMASDENLRPKMQKLVNEAERKSFEIPLDKS